MFLFLILTSVNKLVKYIYFFLFSKTCTISIFIFFIVFYFCIFLRLGAAQPMWAG